jgi:hypothetical protein
MRTLFPFHLAGSESKVDPRILLRLNNIAGQLDPRVAVSNAQLLVSPGGKDPTRQADVCRDTNSTAGDDLLYQRNDPPLCAGAEGKRPISELITILVNNIGSKTFPDGLQALLDGVCAYHSFVPVLVADVSRNVSYEKKIYTPGRRRGNVQLISVKQSLVHTPGAIWNLLVEEVTTPYVLVARDLSHFNAYSRLERQIYMISASEVIGVAGGAYRNSTGHWKVGCYQTDIRNYYLRITEGYKYSVHGCMFCDHLEGPFVARTDVMQAVKMSEDLPEDVLFHDWFLRLKQAEVLAVNCPDAMYFTQGRSNVNAQPQSWWLKLAKEWQVHRIFVPPNVVYLFSCKEVGLSCEASKRLKEHLMPPCCLVQMARAWKVLDEFASKSGIGYELVSGSILGAVKLRTHLPWTTDAAVRFDAREYPTFFRKQKMFNNKGLKLKAFNPRDKGYFQMWTPDVSIEMWGADTLTGIFLPADVREVPTRVYMLGAWVRGVANPGLYAWNKYGANYLKHSPVWNWISENGSSYEWSKSPWTTCPNPQHHACLEHYPTDGSIDFVPQMVH